MPLPNRQYQDEQNTNQNALHCISSFEDTSLKNLQDTVTRSFISCYFYQPLHQQITFFTSSPNFIQYCLKKRSSSQIFIFLHIHSKPHPVNNENLLSVAKVFCQCSLSYHSFSRLLCHNDAQEELEQQSRIIKYFNPSLIPGSLSSYKPLD